MGEEEGLPQEVVAEYGGPPCDSWETQIPSSGHCGIIFASMPRTSTMLSC